METSIKLPVGTDRVAVLGPAERNLKILREAIGVSVTARQSVVTVRGDRAPVALARAVIDQLIEASAGGQAPSRQEVLNLIADCAAGRRGGEPIDPDSAPPPELREWDGRLNVYAAGRPVKPKTANQQAYIEGIRDNDLVFAIGPAGTGKTYLAVAAAVHLLKEGRVKRIVLARPAVEAGERLGFLPGDLRDKVNPYLRPLFDALHDMMDFPTIRRFMENDVVEVVPLAFMRGRTLNNAVIILDEAQNATKGQMKMFLTRLGHGGKMIVTGDVTQIDLENPADCGLIDAAHKLRKTPGVAMVTLDKSDVVRHDLVQRIIEAYGDEKPGGRKGRSGVESNGPITQNPT
ncbi:MAG: PhoH family protein [Phycisphaerales bacterium]